MTSWLGFVVLSALLGSASPSFAQETGGSIEGTVRDASKGVLPGVTVTVTGLAIMGARTVTTDERGSYTVRSLPPGKFEIRAALSGFAPLVREQMEVRVGQTATINFDMSVAGVTESTVVTAEAPVIDLRRNSRNFTIDTEAIAFIPLSTSQQYTDFWVMAPGVRDSLATSTGSQLPSINGASGTQNKVFVDGIDVGDHVNASTTTYLNNAIIQEVAISTGGLEAQSGFGTGGLMNIVTKSGGNQYRGGVSVFLTPKRFNGTNFPGTSPANVESYYPEAHLGGPIQRDRLWFFGSEKYLYENVGIFNVTSYKTKIRSHEFYAKLTHQPHQRHRLAYIFQHDRRLQDPSFGIPSFAFDATPVGHFGGYTTGVNWDYQMGSKTLLAVVASYFDKPNQTDGRNGTAPRTQFANATGIISRDGNYDRDQANEQTRPYFSGVLTRSFSSLGGHDLRLSTELYPRTSRLNRLRLNIIETYQDSPVFGPRQLWIRQTPRPLEGAENDTIDRGYAFGIQDAWRPIRKLTVNGGLRYESNRTEIEGRAEKLLDYDSWSPRIGAAYEINDKTVLKSSVSRIGEKFALDFAFNFFPNRVVYDTATSSQINGVLDLFTNGGSTTGTTTTRNVNRTVPSAIEYLFSVQRQLPWRFALDVSYVHRQYGQFNDSIDRNLILDIPNKRFVGRVDPTFDALFDTTGTGRVERKYRTVQVWLNKRLADRWQFNGSYTYGYTRQQGEFGYFTAGNAALQFAYGDRAREFFEGETGGRHNLKLSGSYTLPYDMTAGVYFSKFSDSISLDTTSQFPANTPAPRVTLPNGRIVSDPLFNPVVLVAPPSEKVGRKIGGTDLLNLQLQKGFKFGTQRLRVTAMAYNLTNEAARLGYSSTYVGNPNYNNLFGVQRPRAGQLSFGWEF